MRIVLPGSGIHELARRLADVNDITLLSLPDLSKTAHEQFSDTTVLNSIYQQLCTPESARGFILDGFPTTLPQAQSLDMMLASLALPVESAVMTMIDYDLLATQRKSRRRCEKCGEFVNLSLSSTADQHNCRFCGSGLLPVKTAKQVDIEIKILQNETEGLRKYYRTQNKLITIDPEQDTSELPGHIESIIARRQNRTARSVTENKQTT